MKQSEVPKPLCTALRTALKRAGVNQSEMANRLGLKSAARISRWCNDSEIPDKWGNKIEIELGMRKGDLRRLANYVEDAKNFADFMTGDQTISDEAKQSLVAQYLSAQKFYAERNGLDITNASSITSRSDRAVNS